MTDQPRDAVNHPGHYADTVPGIECIDVAQHFNFNRGNAIKYLWRAGAKGDELEDLCKAAKYIEFEIKRVMAERAEAQAAMTQEIKAALADPAPPFPLAVIDPDGSRRELVPDHRWHE